MMLESHTTQPRPSWRRAFGRSGRAEGSGASLRTTRALDGFSLEIAPGELVALLVVGLRQDTALRVLAGFEQPDSGSVNVHARTCRGARSASRHGMVFQSYSLFPT